MKYMTANEAKSNFGQLLDSCIREPVAVTKHGRKAMVALSVEDYENLKEAALDRLRTEIRKGIDEYEAGNYTTYDREGLKQLFEDVKRRGRERAGIKPDT